MQSGRQTHNPTLALYKKYGGLAYRLARAMLGGDGVASDVVASVFEELNPGGGTSWYDILSSVHYRCRAAARTVAAVEPIIAVEAKILETDGVDGMPYSAQSMYQAYCSLPQPDQELLWNTLMAANSDEDELRLAEALRRLQIAVTNQSIPTEISTETLTENPLEEGVPDAESG